MVSPGTLGQIKGLMSATALVVFVVGCTSTNFDEAMAEMDSVQATIDSSSLTPTPTPTPTATPVPPLTEEQVEAIVRQVMDEYANLLREERDIANQQTRSAVQALLDQQAIDRAIERLSAPLPSSEINTLALRQCLTDLEGIAKRGSGSYLGNAFSCERDVVPASTLTEEQLQVLAAEQAARQRRELADFHRSLVR